MKIESIRLENFRSFKNETIGFDDYTCFIGPNGVGKSTIFHALNLSTLKKHSIVYNTVK